MSPLASRALFTSRPLEVVTAITAGALNHRRASVIASLCFELPATDDGFASGRRSWHQWPMFRRLNQVIFVLLLVAVIAAALPTTGVFSSASCEWQREGPPPASPVPTTTLSLSLRAGDMVFADGLRARLLRSLKAGGVTTLVDNPLTYPRATVSVTAIEGRWTPFWAGLKMQATVVVDRVRGGRGSHAVDATVVIDGACMGLVNSDEWRQSAMDALAAELHDQLAVTP